MAGRDTEVGPTGKAVAANITRLRGDMSYTQLSRKLKERANWSINAVGVRRIEDCERRVTADDLIAFAVALGVSPSTLLMPSSVEAGQVVAAADTELNAATLWEWLIAEWPFPKQGGLMEFFTRALPSWKLAEVERRIAQRHGERSVADLERPITLRVGGEEDSTDGDH